ncbi:MAG TPA: SusC/RagA family TonB-linked outer membrane protein [Gemmatimonadaceae bacterium]|nr:SusC/RagA family TonB-linked outer membrane protein [Gemmatimonadaceae bacterium]
MKRFVCCCAAFAAIAGSVLALPAVAQAQTAVVSGRVTAETGEAIPAATVAIPALSVGAVTDDQGRYTFAIPASRLTSTSVTVMVRRIGYRSQSIVISPHLGSTTTANFTLAALINQLEGVVTTALGQQREKSQLGTAQQEISSKELNATHSQNFVDQLAGKVSGMVVTSSGTPGASTKITIRGSNSINGDNNPLFVVDGIPVSSDDRGGSFNVGSLSNSASSGLDLGNVINDINPEDIESVSVLKGPNAAALYGSRAANGVIVITTKHGANSNAKLRTALTSTYTWDRPSTYMDWQNLYGQGSGGNFAFKDGKGGGVNDGYDQSYGPRMNGQLIPQFDSPVDAQGNRIPTPFIPHPDNADSFFQTGHSFANTFAVSGGTDNANGRFSIGNNETQGVIPNNTFRNLSSSLAGNFRLGSKFTTSGNVQYIQGTAHNRPGQGYNTGILEQFIWFGRQVNMNELKAQQYDANGNLYNWNYNFHNNPYWLQDYNPEYDIRNRVIGSVSGTYTVNDWLSATLRGGQDYYNWKINRDFAAGNIQYSDPNYAGAFSNATQDNTESNVDLLLNVNKQLRTRLAFTGLLGGTLRRNTFGSTNVSTPGISVPGIYNVSNAAITPTLQQFDSDRRVNSVYESGALTWDNWWTVEATGRTDWSSTLPQGQNSYFYPGVNTSLVLTNALPQLKSKVLTYAKLRGAFARVGSDATPYQLATVFNGSSTKFGSLPKFSLSDNLANANLKPEQTTSSEVGAELAFLDSRVTLDASYYDKETKNQILNLVIPPTSGYLTQAINAGQISNKGFEATLGVTPLRSDNGLNWTSTFNYASNKSKVVALTPGLTTVVLGTQRSASVVATAGQPYGQLTGYTFLRDSSGNLLTQKGLPIRGPAAVLGNVNPRWVGGWNNEFKFKRVTASFLFDFHVGGQFFSNTNMMCDQSGMCANTLRGREVDWNNPGIVVKGIDKASGKPNTVNVTSEQYFQSLWLFNQAYTYTDTYVKLREVRVGYDLPTTLANRFSAQTINVALVGRNLWTQTNVPNIDPEFTYNTGNAQGLEFAPMPTTRSIGITFQVTP